MPVARGTATVIAAIVAAAAIAVPLEAPVHALAIAAATVLGYAWALAGVRRHEPPRSLSRLLIAAAGTNLLFMLVWTVPTVLGRTDLLAHSLLAAGGGVISALVVTRFVLLMRRARQLLDENGQLLARSEARYRQLVEKVPAVVILFKLGPHEPLPVYVSPQSRAILGVSAEEWLADPKGTARRIHADDLVMLKTELERSDKATNQPEFRFMRPDGEEVWVRDVSGVITEEPDGRYLQAMLVDIGELTDGFELVRKPQLALHD